MSKTDNRIKVWRPTPEEWDDYVDSGLQRLGISYEELANQARTCDFQSTEAHLFWVIVGGHRDCWWDH